MKFTYAILISVLFPAMLLGQQKKFVIDWKGQADFKTLPEHKAFFLPVFQSENYQYDYYKDAISFVAQWQETGQVQSAKLTQVSYASITATELKNLNTNNIPQEPKLQLSAAKAKNRSYFVLELSPIVKQNGTFKKVTSFSIAYTKSSSRLAASLANAVPPISNSVLSSGDWFRFYVDKSGVYKLSKSFLESLGLNLNNIDPRTIRIHGHGGDMLPLRNSENLHYDIPETAIQVIGEEDGSFDNQDYILFYAKAVNDKWSRENKTNLNLYAKRSYYYISAGAQNGLRINNYAEPSGSASQTITTFDAYQYYEVDEHSVAKTGRRWFGDRFDVQNEKEYTFNFPNLDTSEPIEITVNAISASESSSSSFAISVNGSQTDQLTYAAINDNVYAIEAETTQNVSVSNDEIKVKLTYNNGGNPASLGYLDYINIHAKRQLIAANKQFEFSFTEAALANGIAAYQISNAAAIDQVWDITNLQNVSTIFNQDSQNTFSFKANLGEERKYIAISPQDYYTPLKEGNPKVANQNLKGNVFKGQDGNFQDVDYLIISPAFLMQQANRLAQHRSQRDNLNIKVVLDTDIYTEFNSGKQDIGAIRNFIKYIYDNGSPGNKIKYVGLLGDASVDFKDRLQNNNNILPIYQSLSSFSLGARTTASDDFYGMMDPEEGTMITNDKLDIAVGRILADSPQSAKTFIDKIIDYESREAYGRWRNNFLLISDDADVPGSGGFQLQEDLDSIGENIRMNKPFINVKKIHSDAFQQVSTAGGQRYPKVNEAISNAIEVGACVVNYFGHGGENGLASERIITIDDIESWQNKNKYNLFVTVTCEFTRFDNPLRLSPGEINLAKVEAGSVAMVTTTRKISVITGKRFNFALGPYLFDYANANISIAESVRLTKNEISGSDRRVVFYFGDPSMKLALAEPKIRLTAINDKPFPQQNDTLKALDRIKFAGEVVNENGNLLSNYNGILSTSVFDKRIDRETLGNDGTMVDHDDNSQTPDVLGIMDFTTLGEIIFRGQASVNSGKFEFDFVVPKDIAVPVGNGRVSFYAENKEVLLDNRGYSNSILVGGINQNAPEDNLGPEIQLYMNDETFVSGGITNSSPFILAKLADENGINTASGIGHDLVAILDGDETDPIVLNNYYETEVDDYTQGTVNYKLRNLEEGLHTLTFKAWDVYNNSSTAEIQFRVADNQNLKITKVLNYPNPFHTYTEFWFNHNRPFEPLEVQVQVFTVSGKIVWTHNQLVNTEGFLSREITWDGRDDFGDRIGKGVYIYKLSVKSTLSNKKVEKFEKLVIL